MSSWSKLTGTEEKTIWRKFKKEFQFRPSIHEKDWPGILEPFHSVTYNISNIFGHQNRKELEQDLQKKLLKIFQAITSNGKFIYAFDWQHSSFKFNPRISNFDDWRIPAFPDGDYYIFLTKDGKNGQFGHPWEKTISIFGEEFLKELKHNMPIMFNELIRQHGKIVK